MEEGIDLNALRAAVPRKDLKEGSPSTELGKSLQAAIDAARALRGEGVPPSEQIALLEAELVRLERARNKPTPLQAFDALSPEEQQAHMARELTGLIAEAEWNKELYRGGLAQASNKNPADLRITVLQERLKKLRGTMNQ